MTNAGKNKGLTDVETSTILTKYLLKKHRDDPNVLKFINSYLSCREAAQAGRAAGIGSSGGQRLKAKPDIWLAITALTDKAILKYGYDAHEIVERMKEVSSFDPIDLVNEDGSYKKNIRDIPDTARRAIKKLTVKNLYGEDPNGMRTVIGEIINYEFWDKIKATELLGREKEIFVEKKKVEHDVTSNMKELLLGSQQRAEAIRDVTPVPIEATIPTELSNKPKFPKPPGAIDE